MSESKPATQSSRKPLKKASAAGEKNNAGKLRSPAKSRPVRAKGAAAASTYYGTGRRKASVARVFLREGQGKIIVNGRPCEEYFGARTHWYFSVKKPLELVGMSDRFDVYITVKGGGMTGQSGAIIHGASRALILFEEEQNATITLEAGLSYDTPIRDALKAAGYTTRDSRRVEPKKVGRHKARRGLQYSKR